MSAIIIYSTPTCAFCHMAKAYFQSKDVDYSDKDVSQDAEAQKEMMNKSQQMGVPVIDINGSIVIGFDRPKIDLLLRKNKLV